MKSGELTYQEMVVACMNVGVDLTCGACAAIFYTGAAPGYPHTCGIERTLTPVVVTFGDESIPVKELLVEARAVMEDHAFGHGHDWVSKVDGLLRDRVTHLFHRLVPSDSGTRPRCGPVVKPIHAARVQDATCLECVAHYLAECEEEANTALEGAKHARERLLNLRAK